MFLLKADSALIDKRKNENTIHEENRAQNLFVNGELQDPTGDVETLVWFTPDLI